MKKKHTILIALILAILAGIFGLPENETPVISTQEIVAAQVMDDGSTLISADGIYTSKEDVALYIHTYGCLPMNFMPKKEARELGWEG